MDRSEYIARRKNLLENRPAPSQRGKCTFDALKESVTNVPGYYYTEGVNALIFIYDDNDVLAGSYNKLTELYNISTTSIVEELNK